MALKFLLSCVFHVFLKQISPFVPHYIAVFGNAFNSDKCIMNFCKRLENCYYLIDKLLLEAVENLQFHSLKAYIEKIYQTFYMKYEND